MKVSLKKKSYDLDGYSGKGFPREVLFECRGKTKSGSGASLVTQWLRIRLPMQGTRVRALVREDPTRHRATKPVCHNY
ncbi:hypothetical protein J1605_018734 [Eschrichtius robustus]|uniref:Uncharacterized protein n=1 Tax=Eschrichtius robustus TaxID=9764 RepID=A0AB34HVF0_ESCRO|nr:hypothetical protein J1605_018734 [Eschrichtius robustus]